MVYNVGAEGVLRAELVMLQTGRCDNAYVAAEGSETVLRYCRNVRLMWVKFNSKDTKESE